MKFLSALFRFFFGNKKRVIITSLIILAVVGFQIRTASKPDHEIDIFTVNKTNFEETITAAGEIKAEKSVDLVFQTAGEIVDIDIKDGNFVKKGQYLAKVDSTKVNSTYSQALANLRAKEASLDAVYDEVQGNDDDETFSERASRTLAETAKDSAYDAVLSAKEDLANTNLIAPFTGVLNYKPNVSIGAYASSLSPSFSLVDPTTVYFEAEVSEIDISNIDIGTIAEIELDAYPDEIFEEVVEVVGFTSVTTSSGGTAYRVKISLPDNIQNKFRIGMNGDVDFVLSSKEEVLSIPLSALVEEDDSEYIWKVKTDQTVEKVEIVTGVSSLDEVEVLSGLEKGDKIVRRPPSSMKDGDKVAQKEDE